MTNTANEHLVHESVYRGDDALSNRSKQSLLILGSGALGSWLTDLLARQGYSQITVLDFDRVERKNFGSQNFGKTDIGRPKATMTANSVVSRLGILCKSIPEKLTDSNIKKILLSANKPVYQLVVDVFDNHESRSLVKDFCAQNKIECLHAGMSGDGFAEVEWNDGYRSHASQPALDKHGKPCEYPLASNLVYFTVALIAEVINTYFDAGVKRSVHFTLKDLHCDLWRER